MFHEIELGVEFYAQLQALDAKLVVEVQRRGCPLCGGRLDRADFPRKPRGLPPEAEPLFERRYALCCASEGCRRRTLPPSVRFLGRMVYAAVVVVVACLAEAARRYGEEIRRVARWLTWWRERLARAPSFIGLRGRFRRPIDESTLPASLLGVIDGADFGERLVRLLVLIAEPVRTLSHER